VKRVRALTRVALTAAAVLAAGTHARAADVVVFAAESLEPAWRELVPHFERSTGDRVTAFFANLGTNAERVRKGDAADVVIVSPPQWQTLQQQGKVDLAMRAMIAKVGVGVFARRGAVRPDIGTVDALKRALLDARAIALRDPGRGSPVGATVTALFARLGIAEAVKPKLYLTDDRPFRAVLDGHAELGFSTLVEIVATPEVDLVGPVPAEVQNFITLVAGIPANATTPAAARALIEFLRSPRALSVLKAKGFETD